MIKGHLFASAAALVSMLATPAWAGDSLRGYATLQGLMGLHSWGGASISALEGDPRLGSLSDPSFSTSSTGGFYLSGNYVFPGERLHIGGYLSYQGTEMLLFADSQQTTTRPEGLRFSVDQVVHDLSVGLSARLAGRATRRFWFGAALDLGPSFLLSEGERLAAGFRLFPRLTFDHMYWTLRQRFQLGISVSMGLVIEAYAAGQLDYVTPDTGATASSDFSYSFVRPMLMVGGSFGL